MEDASQYYKFIPLILYIVYKIFGGGKKKEQKPKPRPVLQKKTEPKRPSPIEELLRELSGEPEAKLKPVVETVPQKSKRAKSNKIKIEDHQYDFRPEYEHHADTGKDIKQIRQEMSDNKLSKSKEVKGSGIDLKQAIIYDAILNRPEY